MIDLDAADRALLEQVQAAFPLVPRPFAALGQTLGLDEADVLARTRRLREAGLIRQIGALFDTRRLGYQSTLVAFHVPSTAPAGALDVGDGGQPRLEEVAAVVSAHPGVSHNYARPHHYNLWFTLAVPPGRDLAAAIDRLATRAGVDDWLNLPALRVFKLRTHFALRERQAGPGTLVGDAEGHPHLVAGGASEVPSQDEGLDPEDIPFIQALQADLPLEPRPFAPAAGRLGVSEEELLDKAHRLASAGILRRFGAVLRHRRVGYRANGMACWAVPEPRIEEAGRYAAGLPQVSHCYQRPAFPPRWPYTLFTMIHGQSEDEVEVVAAEIAEQTGIEQYEILYSTREFKKERVRYFEEEA